jgi:hypothetical protein
VFTLGSKQRGEVKNGPQAFKPPFLTGTKFRNLWRLLSLGVDFFGFGGAAAASGAAAAAAALQVAAGRLDELDALADLDASGARRKPGVD